MKRLQYIYLAIGLLYSSHIVAQNPQDQICIGSVTTAEDVVFGPEGGTKTYDLDISAEPNCFMTLVAADDSDWFSAFINNSSQTITFTVDPLTEATGRSAPGRINVRLGSTEYQRGGFGISQEAGCLQTWYRDSDGDTFGDPNDTQVSCNQPSGYVNNNQDCNDNNGEENPDAIWYADSDNDGLGDPNTVLNQCVKPDNYVSNNSDWCPTVSSTRNECFSKQDVEDIAIYLNTGSDQDVDYKGNVFRGDANSPYHNSTFTTENIDASPTEPLFQTERYSNNTNMLNYAIPVPAGRYTVITYHNEIWFGKKYLTIPAGNGKRVFDIAIEGELKKEIFDIHVENGGQPIAFTFEDVIVKDGELNIDLTDINNNATLSGLAIIGKGKVPPLIPSDTVGLHINVGSAVDANYKGITYLADANLNYVLGSAVAHTNHNSSAIPLYQSERWYSVLSYNVPIPNGVYTVITHHNELYYRADSGTQKAQAGNRVFDIKLEGKLVKGNTDIFVESNLNPLVLTFEDILVTDGILNLQMEASIDNATLSGLSIIPKASKEMLYTIIKPSNSNYIYTKTFQTAFNNSSEIAYRKDVIEDVTYFDGLGRPIQHVGIKQSADGKDIITHIAYDNVGRENKNYLPFVAANGRSGTYRTAATLGSNPALATNKYYLNEYAEDFPGITDPKFVNAYSEKIYEPSPINRVLKTGAPGLDWKAKIDNDLDHTIKSDWTTNDANEVVVFRVIHDINNPNQSTLIKQSYYAPGELSVFLAKDENWTAGDLHTTKEYKNKQGQVLLKRTYNTVIIKATPKIPEQQKIVAHDTYYVYDDFGNLTYVIPPKVDTSDGVSAIELSELCYQYKYDYRNRLFEKKIPGKGFESIIYNLRDEPIATQDANLREKKQWLFTRYDDFGRVAYTGIVNNTLDRETLQKVANDRVQYATLLKGLDDIVAMGGDLVFEQTPTPANPNSRIEILTINYYDNYDFTTVTPPTSGSEELFKQQLKENVTSYPTGSKVRVLDTNTWINTINYYDYKGRPIYNYSKNEYLSTIDITVSELDFTGRIMQAKTTHTKNTKEPIVTIDRFEYDHVGRLVSQTQELNNSGHKERITENRYDALGVLTNKKVGGAAQGTLGLQDVAYKYNVRGWLTGINDRTEQKNSLFGFTIGYNNPTSGTALFNGNISETIWSAAGGTRQNRYTYNYDALNRITSATSNENNYNLNEVSYDKVGNILGINRSGYDNGFGVIDDLVYKYDTGNKLLSVTDNAPEEFRDGGFKDQENLNGDYKYDANGNMIADGNKRINEIVYNHLNLPISIISGARHESIEYKYDATGVKIEKCLTKKDVKIFTKYAGNFVYQKNTNPGAPNAPDQLQFFNHPEGYIEQENDGSFSYIYQYKDHLGNIRLSYSDADQDGKIDIAVMYADLDGDGDFSHEIREVKNYYPFGLQHKGYNNVVNGTENNHFTYVGQELNESLDYNMLEMDWRHYDPAIGRFVGIDAMADSYYSLTPYQYSMNNPIWFKDPTGLYAEAWTTWVHNTETDEMLWIDDGYNFTLDVSNDEFNQIKKDGAIESGTSAYNRWFWKAVWEDLTTSDGTVTDDVTQFVIIDEVEDGLETIDEMSNGNYTAAVLALFLKKVQKAKKGAKLIKKLFKYGDKSNLPTPDLNPEQFTKKAGKFIHKKTGAIFSKSHTSHGNVGNTGDQWKAWSKGTTEFGNASKKAGDRITIDGAGKVIGN